VTDQPDDGKRRRMPRADREQQMLAVAEQVFAERGFRSASMDEIAERVGVTKPMLYAYFGSKDRLLLACVARARAELREATSSAYLDAHTQTWAMLRNEGAAVGAVAAEIEAIRRQQTELIAQASRGFVAGTSTDSALIEVYAEMLVGATERVSLWRERNPDITPEQAADLMVTVVWHGLATILAATPAAG
jgi:AcrR family transcriptional regulator